MKKKQYINVLLNNRFFRVLFKTKRIVHSYKKIKNEYKNHNEITLNSIEIIEKKKVLYNYSIDERDSFKKLFWEDIPFSIEYSENIDAVPESILVIHFVSNVLLIIWFTNPKLSIKSIDKDFYESIPIIKKHYKNMLKHIKFNGKNCVANIEENSFKNNDNAVTFFSGGVDSFSTLINNLNYKPTLVTICGGDIDFGNEEEWNVVKSYSSKIGNNFNLQNIFIKSSLRAFINNTELENEFIEKLKDNWWHAVQHGIGMISLVAPFCYKKKISKFFFHLHILKMKIV